MPRISLRCTDSPAIPGARQLLDAGYLLGRVVQDRRHQTAEAVRLAGCAAILKVVDPEQGGCQDVGS